MPTDEALFADEGFRSGGLACLCPWCCMYAALPAPASMLRHRFVSLAAPTCPSTIFGGADPCSSLPGCYAGPPGYT